MSWYTVLKGQVGQMYLVNKPDKVASYLLRRSHQRVCQLRDMKPIETIEKNVVESDLVTPKTSICPADEGSLHRPCEEHRLAGGSDCNLLTK